MIDHDSVSILRAAPEAFGNGDDALLRRSGQLLESDDPETFSKILVVGDVHSELDPLRAVIKDCRDELQIGTAASKCRCVSCVGVHDR